ncbi:hypothetical protein C8R46DRAFT_1311734 [Mycena filopes]|nr:hypothetical protein C8R46DRAFT_1311734 [Mycena filopes]
MMQTDPAAYSSVPFLSPNRMPAASSSDFEVQEKVVHSYDPPFLFGAAGHPRTARERRRLTLQQFVGLGWPVLVIGGLVLLQAAAWIFFAVLQSRGGISLPYDSAVWAHNHAHEIDWLTTLLATTLAFFSTYLFSTAVRESAALHLRGEGMSVAGFIASLRISTRSLILDRDRKKWKLTSLSIAVFVFTGGVQTAGWKALITPFPIIVTVPLTGHEIDLASPLLGQVKNNTALSNCITSGTSYSAFIVGQTDSGYAAAKAALSIGASFSMMDQTVNETTGGIFPLTLESRNSSTWFPGTTTIPASVRTIVDPPIGLDSRYSLTQQGFTADVSCKRWSATDSSMPLVYIDNTTVRDWNNTATRAESVRFSDLWSNCAVDDAIAASNWSRSYTLFEQHNYLLMIACRSQDGYQLIFNSDPTGIYGFMETTICSLTPKITAVQVNYSAGALNTTALPTVVDVAADPGSPATLAAVKTLYSLVFFSQSSVSNGVGDKLRSLIAEEDGVHLTYETTLRLTEAYIRGVTEYSGSVFRACLSANTGFLDALPSDMNVTTGGLFHVDSVGWLHASPVTFLELIPGTLVAFYAIYAVLTTLGYHRADENAEPFNATDPMHLMSASSAGHLNNVFTGTRRNHLRTVEEATVFLRDVPGRGPVLVRSDVM